MCMQYINANVALFKKIVKSDAISFSEPFHAIAADGKAVGGFSIASYFTLLGSGGGKAKNVIDRKGELDVCIRLMKCAPDENERVSYDLDEFQINAKDATNLIHDDACVPYLNYKRVSNIERIGIRQPEGSWVVKILVREPGEKKYVVQSMHHLTIT